MGRSGLTINKQLIIISLDSFLFKSGRKKKKLVIRKEEIIKTSNMTMAKKKQLNFEIRHDTNALSDMRFMMRICLGDTCVHCPRYSCLQEALECVELYRKEYAPEQKRIRIMINL